MSAINVGDLVVVYKPCPNCGDGKDLGLVFRVDYIAEDGGESDCCGPCEPSLCAFPPLPKFGYGIETVKRIPPLDELEGVRTEEDIREPA